MYLSMEFSIFRFSTFNVHCCKTKTKAKKTAKKCLLSINLAKSWLDVPSNKMKTYTFFLQNVLAYSRSNAIFKTQEINITIITLV